MKLEKITSWFKTNWLSVLITGLIVAVLIAIGLTLHKVFGSPAGPDVSKPGDSKPEMDRMTSIYLQYKPALSKDDLFYKNYADSIQGYLQTHTFFGSSDLYEKYFSTLNTADFVAVFYFWGTSREYSGSFWSNPFQGLDDKYGNLTEALQVRCYASDFSKIQQKFSSTGLI